MTTVICAATNCVNNNGGICGADEIKFAQADGSSRDLRCETYEPREPGDGKKRTVSTGYGQREEDQRASAVTEYHQK